MNKKIYILFVLILLIVGCTKTNDKVQEKNKTSELSFQKEDSIKNSMISKLNASRGPETFNNRTLPKDFGILQEFNVKNRNINSVSGIATTKDGLYIVDKSKHNIIFCDYEGNIKKSIGKLGSAPGEFNAPGDIYVKNNLIYVLDGTNKRVQVFNKNLDYEREISIVSLEFPRYDGTLNSIYIDDRENLYITTKNMGEEHCYIWCLTKEGKIIASKDRFDGILIEKDGAIYALESRVIEIIKEEDKIIGVKAEVGQTGIFKVIKGEKELNLEKFAEIPREYTPVDMVWEGDRAFIASNLWNACEEFKYSNGNLEYVKPITPQFSFEIMYNFHLAKNNNILYLSNENDGKIYAIEINQ